MKADTTTNGMQQEGTAASHVAASRLLQARLSALRVRHLSVEAGKGLCLCIIICLELLALLMFADWWLDFPWKVRLGLFLAQFAVLNGLLYWYVFRHWFRPPDDEDLALRVEKAHPELRSRLISSVQFAKPGSLSPGASVGLAYSTVEQTEAMTASMDFRRIVSMDSLRRLGVVAGMVLMLMLAAFFASWSVSLDLLRRALLAEVPVPRKTRIVTVTGHLTVGRGDTVVIESTARGVIPRQGSLILSSQEKREQTFPLEPAPGIASRFSRALENVQEDFDYQVRLNDSLSPAYQVKVVPRPTVNQLECETHPPAYTGLKPGRRSPGDLTLLAGSRLRIRAVATQDLESAQLRLLGPETRQPLPVAPGAPRELAGDIAVPVKGLTGFAFELLDTAGMRSPEGTVYRIDILPDKAPQVKITWPERKEELLTRLATLVVGFEVFDDFLISKLALRYKVSTVDQGAEKVIELALDPQPAGRLKRRYEWRMASFQPPLPEGTLIEYWIEAHDNNDVTGPGVGVSEHQIARVVSENEKRSDLLNRAGDSMGVLGDVTADQEKLNRSLGTLILERTGAR